MFAIFSSVNLTLSKSAFLSFSHPVSLPSWYLSLPPSVLVSTPWALMTFSDLISTWDPSNRNCCWRALRRALSISRRFWKWWKMEPDTARPWPLWKLWKTGRNLEAQEQLVGQRAGVRIAGLYFVNRVKLSRAIIKGRGNYEASSWLWSAELNCIWK